MAVNTEFIREWVDALRSGDYLQGVGALRRRGEFCCLGVACDLLVKKGVLEERLSGSGTTMYGHTGDQLSWAMGTLPSSALDFLGGSFRMRVMVPGIVIPLSLVVLNDDEGRSFDEIATVLENNYLRSGE